MASVLGRITTSEDTPRGPDVKHKVRVLRRWLERGETISVELPRNLVCARCDGGGCDACGGAGALSLRGRRDAPEVVELTLPATGSARVHDTLALRIPERGGLPVVAGLPRGMLILSVIAADRADSAVHKVRPSLRPPPPAAAEPEKLRESPEAGPPALFWPLVLGVAVLCWLSALLLMRALGWL